jgi:hypothetical protein
MAATDHSCTTLKDYFYDVIDYYFEQMIFLWTSFHLAMVINVLAAEKIALVSFISV